MWDLIVSVPDHCLSFYFSHDVAHITVGNKDLPRVVPGTVARSNANPPGMQTDMGFIHTFGNILSWRLAMK